MTETKWTRYIRIALINKGKQLEYDTTLSNKDNIIEAGDYSVKLRPDIVWSKHSTIRYIFEIDTGARDVYQKTIYGSILSGIVMAKQRNAVFIEVVPRSPSGKKALAIVEILKNEFESLPTFHTVQIGRISGKCMKENIQKALTKELKKRFWLLFVI